MATINDKIKFTAAKWSHLGTCVVAQMSVGRVWIQWSLTCIEGTNKGKSFGAKTRIGGKGLEQFGEVIGKAKAAGEKAREAKREKEDKKYEAVRKADKTFEKGDLVRIETSKDSWRMKVMEIDWKAGRIKGVNADSHNPGSRMAWASLTHPDVKVTLIQKAFFDPSKDATVALQQQRAARAGAKRAATRREKETLNNIFGRF